MQNGSSQRPREDSLPTSLNKKQNIITDQSHTPLHLAVFTGDEKTVEILLSSGADRNAKDSKHGNTPLHEAAWRGYSRCVRALCVLPKIQPPKETSKKSKNLKSVVESTQGALHSALLGTRNAGGFSALHLAAQNGHNQSCREILLAGADPDVQNNYGDTPLHTACRYGHAGATRILLSAKCDALRVNLNGDSPLHIACAMGRRKLTRILFEVGGTSSLKLKNAQGETARDIALRKKLTEIVDFLNSPPPKSSSAVVAHELDEKLLKGDRDRSSSSSRYNKKKGNDSGGDKDKLKKKTKIVANVPESDGVNPKNWSPYGCHYFPDPRTFPSPKLETLPKEPLSSGEQYFLDLAGNIRKGPVGVGNTCYCGPFFRHIEQRISQNKKSFKKYVQKATVKLDSKVQALALQTDDKIEQIARSMMAERGFDGRRAHLEQWLKRGDQLRATVTPHSSKNQKEETNNNTLTRCRSLELLDDYKFAKRLDQSVSGALRRSYEFHDINHHDIIIHHGMNDDIETIRSSSVQRSTIPSGSDRRRYSSNERRNSSEKEKISLDREKQSSNDQYECDIGRRRDNSKYKSSLLVAERLEELLSKTNEIIQMERISRRKYKENSLTELSTNKLKVSSPSQRTIQTSATAYDDSLIKKFQRLDYNYTNDHDDIADEMKNITTLLGSPIGSNNSKSATSSSHHSIDHKSFAKKLFHEHDRSTEQSDDSYNKKLMQKPSTNDIANTRSHLNSEPTNGLYNVEDHEIGQQSTYCPADEIDGSTLANTSLALHQVNDGFFQNTCFEDVSSSSSNTLKSVKYIENADNSVNGNDEIDSRCDLPEMANMKELYELKSRILNGAHWRSQVLRKSTQDIFNKIATEITTMPNEQEQGDGVIATDAHPSIADPFYVQTSKVNNLIAKFQTHNTHKNDERHAEFVNDPANSESSEDDDDNQLEFKEKLQLKFNYLNNHQPHQQNEPPLFGPKPKQINTTKRYSDYNSHPPLSHAQAAYDTRYLIPKDAYFHDLPTKNHFDAAQNNQNIIENGLPSQPPAIIRHRNPLPYTMTSDAEILSNGQPPPLPKFLKNVYFNNNNLTQVSNFHKPLNDNPIEIPSDTTILSPPNREKLLTNRKFGPIPVTASTIDPEITRRNLKTIDKAQIERDNNINNDSGYSTKLSGSSHDIDFDLNGISVLPMNGNISANAQIPTNHNNGQPQQILSNGHRPPLIDSNSNEFMFSSNIGASSLV